MRRDVQEGRARCLVHLGRHTEALEIAANLVSGLTASSPSVVLGLLNSYFLKDKTKNSFLQAAVSVGLDKETKIVSGVRTLLG